MKKLLILPLLILGMMLFTPIEASADHCAGKTGTAALQCENEHGQSPASQTGNNSASSAACEQLRLVDPNAACGAGEAEEFIDTIVGQILNILFLVLGAVSVIMVVIGGFRYVLSSGNPENTKAAYNTIQYAAIGLIVAIAAQAIIRFVLNNVGV